MSNPTVSVVINTYNRATSLEQTLLALRYQTYVNFETIVVDGPSDDSTEQMLERWASSVNIGRCPVRNLSVSRNIGICMAAGDIVAFIDDDAVPEPEWLADLLTGYDSEEVAATGGTVFNHTGYEFQCRYISGSRLGNANWAQTGPADLYNFPGSLTLPYLMGTNSSFRRSALLQIGGFDEEYEYYLDETDVCLRLIDRGYVIRQLPNAFVHHKFAPSHLRTQERVVKSWYPIIKNKIYFSIKNNPDMHFEDILEDCRRFVASWVGDVNWHISAGILTETDRQRCWHDVDMAWRNGIARGIAPERELITPTKLDRYAAAYKRFETLCPVEDRLTLCLLSQDYPPSHGGGIGRLTANLARAISQLGHNVHVLTRGEGHNRVDFEDGVWVHRMVVTPHARPRLPLTTQLPQHIWDYSATMLDELVRINTHRRIDIVEAPIWDVEGIAILLDGQFRLVTGLYTTLKSALQNHPEWERDRKFMKAFGHPVLDLERHVMLNSAAIHAGSRAIVNTIERDYGLMFPANKVAIIPHGLLDIGEPISNSAKLENLNLLFVGRLEKRKGIDVLLAAAANLLATHPTVRMTIVGDDTLLNETGRTYKEEFHATHQGQEFLPRINFTGKVSESELYKHYASCDVFVAPSRFESFGLIYLEAMMFGKPVVGCNAGGIPEVVIDGEYGFLAEPGDAVSLLFALDKLLSNAALREQFGKRGRQEYERRFTAAGMARKAVTFYKSLLNEQEGTDVAGSAEDCDRQRSVRQV